MRVHFPCETRSRETIHGSIQSKCNILTTERRTACQSSLEMCNLPFVIVMSLVSTGRPNEGKRQYVVCDHLNLNLLY